LDDHYDTKEINNAVFSPTPFPHVQLLVHTTSYPKTRFYLEKSLLLGMRSKVISAWVTDENEPLVQGDFPPLVFEVLFRLFLRPFDPRQITIESACNMWDVVDPEWNPCVHGHDLLKLSFKLDVPDVTNELAYELASAHVSRLDSLLETLVLCKFKREAETLVNRWLRLTCVPRRKDKLRARRLLVVRDGTNTDMFCDDDKLQERKRFQVNDGSGNHWITDEINVYSCCTTSLRNAIGTWQAQGRHDLIGMILTATLNMMAADSTYLVLEPKPQVDTQMD
jgi:hypothetical protein